MKRQQISSFVILVLVTAVAAYFIIGAKNFVPLVEKLRTAETNEDILTTKNEAQEDTILDEETNEYVITATIPFGVPIEVSTYMQNVVSEFKSYEYVSVGGGQYILALEYEKIEHPDYTSYIVGDYQFTGGANGNASRETFVYDHNNNVITLNDLLVRETSKQEIADKLIMLLSEKYGDTFFPEGVDTETGSLENFYLTKSALGFAFSEYAVAPGVAGAVTIEIPLSELYGIINQTEPVSSDPKPAPTPEGKIVTDFFSCMAADGIVAESYPRQCYFGDDRFVEIIDTEPAPGDGIVLDVTVGPERVTCGRFDRIDCMILDGQNFYDEIDGFIYEAGYQYKLKIEKTLRFGTTDPTKIPEDAGMYAYKLIKLISKTKTNNTQECVVAGCSGQLCISAEEAKNGGGISTCEFREEYACYGVAVCETQTTGECGWTQNQELEQCLSNPQSLQ